MFSCLNKLFSLSIKSLKLGFSLALRILRGSKKLKILIITRRRMELPIMSTFTVRQDENHDIVTYTITNTQYRSHLLQNRG